MTETLSDLYESREHFNSHPHKEDDFMMRLDRAFCDIISTHILTRRMTLFGSETDSLKAISTHILTRRMTEDVEYAPYSRNISTHILTRRMTEHPTQHQSRATHFNSHPHKEDDVSDSS